MKQAVIHTNTLISVGGATSYFPVIGSPELTGGDTTTRTPLPWRTTVRNLTVICRDPARDEDLTVTVMKNGMPTGLTLLLPAGNEGPVSCTDVDVRYSRFDDINIKFQNNTTGSYIAGFSVECESQGNVYGISNHRSSPTVVGNGAKGGALGNGVQDQYTTGESNSYSICSIPGRATTLVARCYSGAPAPGSSWIGYVRLNGDLQDGSGGTADTRCVITAGNTTAVSTFNLPLAIGDHVELIYLRTGSDVAGAFSGHVGLGLGFVPDEDGWYMLTGGSNNTITQPGYLWMRSAQNETDEDLATAPIGLTGITARGLYLECSPPGTGDAVIFTLRRSGEDTDISVTVSDIETSGSINQLVRFTDGHTIDISMTAVGSPTVPRVYWGLALSSETESGVIGPLAWVHWPRRLPGSPAEIETDSYSDMDMQCPADWENGFKEGLITQWGQSSRPSSHLFTGDWQGTTFNFQIADKQGRFRAQAASLTNRYWNDALTVRMTTRANRAELGRAFTVFCGPIIEVQPTAPLLMDMTLGDVVSQGLLSDKAEIPWRKIRDSFLGELTAISENLDLDSPEPILYGRHTRARDEETSPETSEGFRVKPIYLGQMFLPVVGDDYHVWMVCGHAVEEIDIFIDNDEQVFEGIFGTPNWLIPGHANFYAEFDGETFVDKVDAFGKMRRYTLVFGQVGSSRPDDCALGDRELTAAVHGIEDAGDGSGSLITDRFQQYKHFLINYVANQGPDSYHSGEWLENPTWDVFDGPVEKVDEESFNDATDVGEERLIGGYIGVAAIGIGAGSRATAKKWIADWNRSCACRFGVNHFGQMHIYLLRPTLEIKEAAPLYTDAYEILDGSFATEWKKDEQATAISFKADYEDASGEWRTSGVEEDTEASENYGGTIASEPREYPFAPGEEQARHLAILEKRIRKHRPTYIRLQATVGPNPVDEDSLGYRDQGEYIRYVSFDAVQETRQERLAQVIEPEVDVAGRTVGVVAMDCEDLIDYDVDSSPSPP